MNQHHPRALKNELTRAPPSILLDEAQSGFLRTGAQLN